VKNYVILAVALTATLIVLVHDLVLEGPAELPTVTPSQSETSASAQSASEPTQLVTPVEPIEEAPQNARQSAPPTQEPALEALSRAELERQVRELTQRVADLSESLESERAKLTSASAPKWHALQVLGPPDADPSRDDPKAWAAATADGGSEWLELTFNPPRRANLLRIYEVNVPGAVVSVRTTSENGQVRGLWAGLDPLTAPGVFELPFPVTKDKIARVRIEFDTSLHAGWNEIDAVELVGPDGRGWVTSATASSYFGESAPTQVPGIPLSTRFELMPDAND